MNDHIVVVHERALATGVIRYATCETCDWEGPYRNTAWNMNRHMFWRRIVFLIASRKKEQRNG